MGWKSEIAAVEVCVVAEFILSFLTHPFLKSRAQFPRNPKT